MKKKLGMILFAVTLFGTAAVTTTTTTASAGPNCYWVGSVWICEY